MNSDRSTGDWKDRMFRTHADAFAAIASARPMAADLSALFSDARSGAGRLAILDLGCGSGRFLRPLAQLASLVVGLDYSPELLERAAVVSREWSNTVLVRGDARRLEETFVAGEFDGILRAYTSLGYFPRDVEREILRQCAYITRPGGKLVIDCFNKAWFEVHGRISRSTVLDTFALEEEYAWDAARDAVVCTWRYVRTGSPAVEIPFTLDGYGADAMVEVLRATGWGTPRFVEDLATCKSVADPSACERIVAIATRADSA